MHSQQQQATANRKVFHEQDHLHLIAQVTMELAGLKKYVETHGIENQTLQLPG